MAIDPKIFDEVLADCETPEDVSKLYSQLLQRMSLLLSQEMAGVGN